MAEKIVIIGAGISGLSAGCYACMNGYKAEIYETQAKPGGLCTAWKRKGYTIDGCIHWLTGSSPEDSFFDIIKMILKMRPFIKDFAFCNKMTVTRNTIGLV